jgi:hypothetical protein
MHHVAINKGDGRGPLHNLVGFTLTFHSLDFYWSNTVMPLLPAACPTSVWVPLGHLVYGRPPLPCHYKSHRVAPNDTLLIFSHKTNELSKGYIRIYTVLTTIIRQIYHFRVSTHTDTLGTPRFSFSGEFHTRSARHLILIHQNTPSDTFVPRATEDTKSTSQHC